MFGRKKKLTTEQLAKLSYRFAKEHSLDYAHHEQQSEKSPFKDVHLETLAHERLILAFWVIDAFFADKEHKLTGGLHKEYFLDTNILQNKEKTQIEMTLIMNRYKEYYDLYDNEAGSEQHLLNASIAKNFLQQQEPVMNFLVSMQVGIDFVLLIKLLKESIFDQYELKQ